MHIPSGASQTVALLPFEEALALSDRVAAMTLKNGCMCRIFTPNTGIFWAPGGGTR